MMRFPIGSFLSLALIAAGLSACDRVGSAPIDVVLVGDKAEALSEDGGRLGAGDALVSATHEGLVDFDAEGRISPGLAESWLVTDDGLSYIFRLRPMRDAEGQPINARDVRRLMLEAIKRQEGTALGLDLAGIDAIQARTSRVIEVRLKSPVPEFLNLLAASELALLTGRVNPHALVLDSDNGEPRLVPPQVADESDNPYARADALDLRILPPKEAVEFFQDGRAAVLLNGNIDGLPFVRMGGLLRGSIRLDPVSGLFGLAVARHDEGFLSDPANRESIAMAINRQSLIEPFNIGGWVPTNRLMPVGLPDSASGSQERWQGVSMEDRQAVARRRVASWAGSNDAVPPLTIALPPGRGGDLLYGRLRRDLSAIGLGLVRVGESDDADLWLVDEVANYRMARWYLHRFDCSVTKAVCSPEADALVGQAIAESDEARRVALMAEAEALLVAQNGFIPFGAPIRFSLVRGSIEGFAVNALGVHPLSPLALAPI